MNEPLSQLLPGFFTSDSLYGVGAGGARNGARTSRSALTVVTP